MAPVNSKSVYSYKPDGMRDMTGLLACPMGVRIISIANCVGLAVSHRVRMMKFAKLVYQTVPIDLVHGEGR